ncbi:unnamed protein product [Schistocephalus solidus]|uniref:ANF_receptor domain-containing protein n=1 Tax=Schistocephalus solidus TaxID=70667 RepID=A0A183SHI8_SCHSO|nr:unnamed protein product [Schistocephalus solidus]
MPTCILACVKEMACTLANSSFAGNASLQLTVDLARNITALSSKATINATEYQYWSLKEIIDNETTLIPTGHVFLNAYDTFFAEMTSILNNTYISADMPARNAYAPIIRNDPEIKFISNKNDMLATMIVAILRQTNNDLVLIYNDQTELDFLTRQMKALYYTTFKLDPTWEQNLERLKNVFQRKTIARSYVLLLDRKTLKETANQLLNYALIQQQMKKGVEWILFSLDFSCNDVFSHFKNTGATFYCFAQSDVFTPLEPLQPYTRKQTLAAQYIDALTYITTKSTMVGSWQPGRNPPLMLTPASTSLQGRTVNVGFIQVRLPRHVDPYANRGDRA